ncbi:MAG: hypothetical protein K8L97_18225 [Anaerolineae bacterium]|nr:hypothetical protein [Anaerolineae bacterium]
MADADSCPCLEESQQHTHYQHIRSLGVDETNGRFGDVELWQCKSCGRYWLRYLVEYEHLTASGRYFMGLITLEGVDNLPPEKTIPYLESLDWHFYGGSYFDGKKGKSFSHHIPVDS